MSLWKGTVCANCEKRLECAEAKRMFKSGAIAYGCSGCVPKPQTNADRIRSMSDEELAKYLYKHDFCTTPFNSDAQNWCGGDCEQCIDNWIRSPMEVDNG